MRSHCHREARPGCGSAGGWVPGFCLPGCHRRAPTQWWGSRAGVSVAVEEASQAATIPEGETVKVEKSDNAHSGLTGQGLQLENPILRS